MARRGVDSKGRGSPPRYRGPTGERGVGRASGPAPPTRHVALKKRSQNLSPESSPLLPKFQVFLLEN